MEEPPLSTTSVRRLKIEEDGDRWKGIRPKIRITGKWLERAGFKAGTHVHVICKAPGKLELRSSESLSSDELQHLRGK